MLDNWAWPPDAQQQHANTTLASAPAIHMVQACQGPCLTCNSHEHSIIWCRVCNFGECTLCVDARGYLHCLCSVNSIQLTADAAVRNGIYALSTVDDHQQAFDASMVIINRSKAVLIQSRSSAAGTVLYLPEARFAVDDEGELTHLEPTCKDLQFPLDCSAFRFLSFDPCIIIANTDDFSTERIGNLGWVSIDLMRDPLTSVQLHVLSHNLSVACGAVQHSRPEVWRQSYPLSTDGISQGTPCQGRAPLPLTETSITEKEILAEERARKFIRQTTAEYYRAADAEKAMRCKPPRCTTRA